MKCPRTQKAQTEPYRKLSSQSFHPPVKYECGFVPVIYHDAAANEAAIVLGTRSSVALPPFSAFLCVKFFRGSKLNPENTEEPENAGARRKARRCTIPAGSRYETYSSRTWPKIPRSPSRTENIGAPKRVGRGERPHL